MIGSFIINNYGIFDFTGIEIVDHLLSGSIGYLEDEAYKDMLKKVNIKLIINSCKSEKAPYFRRELFCYENYFSHRLMRCGIRGRLSEK
ncbi:hypothetical protein [Priestia megaterium]|jgi:hypothetical protein|uniref:hypothetical protein n=1 Tax=Priestia megaterium TaxID=1404 RepID=UPI0016429F69|nr:hypothetical protein [Priestia megaterium]